VTPFNEVPIGHIFQWPECDCVCRRTDTTVYVNVTYCERHSVPLPLGAGLAADRFRSRWGGYATTSDVRYDPFVAMLEAGEVEGA
jgi:hypothetical protein